MATLNPVWTALATSLVLVGCSAEVASNAAAPGGDEPSLDGGSVACSSRSGDFACGPGVCSRAIQACTTGTCQWYGDLGVSCGLCPTCACLRASPMNVSTCDDDGHGGITFAIYPGAENDPCKSDSDCTNGGCLSGVCHCLPAGATLPATATNACCSGWDQSGVCTAQGGSGCTTRVPDCNGGTCAAGTCTCVGSGGYCNVDADCCAGTSHCAQGQCQ